METKVKSKKSIVVFECNKQDILAKGHSSDYDEQFRDFIRSLDFDVPIMDNKSLYGHTEKATINDIEVMFDYSCASYIGESAYGKERKPRKERYILIRPTWSHSEYITKIPFNVELDADKLRNKIQAFIDTRTALEKEVQDRKNAEGNQLERLKKHYTQASMYITEVRIQNGKLTLILNDNTTLFIDEATGHVIRFHIPSNETPIDKLGEFALKMKCMCDTVYSASDLLAKLGAPGFNCEPLKQNGVYKYITIAK